MRSEDKLNYDSPSVYEYYIFTNVMDKPAVHSKKQEIDKCYLKLYDVIKDVRFSYGMILVSK